MCERESKGRNQSARLMIVSRQLSGVFYIDQK